MATDYLLEIDGIKGESQDEKHKDKIEVHSFSWGVDNSSNVGVGGGGGTGKASFSDLTFFKQADKASPLLFKFCALSSTAPKAGSTLLPKAVVHLCRFTVRDQSKNYVTYARLHFEQCNISSISLRVADEGHTTEDIEMSYEKVAFIYNEIAQGPKGGETRFGWEVTENKEWAGPPKK